MHSNVSLSESAFLGFLMAKRNLGIEMTQKVGDWHNKNKLTQLKQII